MSDQQPGGSYRKFLNRNRAEMDTPVAEGAEGIATGAADDFDPADLVPDGKRPYSIARVKRQPGFFIVMAVKKRRYWVWYHSIQNLMMQEGNTGEFLEFTHEHLAVSIKGRNLEHLQNLIAFGRVAAIFEPSAAPLQSADCPTVIFGVLATDVTERKDDREAERKDDQAAERKDDRAAGPKLVKP